MIRFPQRLPDPTVPLVEPKTGRVNPIWYQYLREVDDVIRKLVTASNEYDRRITELELP